MDRLTRVERSLDALDEAKAPSSNFPQQEGLLKFYVSSMRVEVDLAKLHLTIAGVVMDFSALARAAETMSDLTHDFTETIRAWGGRVKRQIGDIAKNVPKQVRKFASGVRSSAQWAIRLGQRRSAASETAPSSDPKDKRALQDIDSVREMIASGKAPPQPWPDKLFELDLSGVNLGDLTPVASLTGLHRLSLRGTAVDDLAPLTNLTNLEWLDLRGTQVHDLKPLANLVNLVWLDLRETPTIELVPITALRNLRGLHLQETPVGDIAPLAHLRDLQWLSLQGTQVSSVAPLAGLRNLQTLYLAGTQVTDFAPVAHINQVNGPDRQTRRKFKFRDRG